MKPLHLALIFLFLLGLAACTQTQGVDSTGSQNLPPAYIQNKGSDTIVNLALAWAEEYQQIHPEVRISVTGGGTGTGIASLINHTVDLASASRKIKAEESDKARQNGVEPVEFIIARDAIAVIVNPHNPVTQLSLQQISDIYTGKYTNWKQVGGADRKIVRLSRETNSGTHVYFLETVLRLGQKENHSMFSTDTLLLPSSEGITSEVRDNPNAIGYDGLGYVTADVKVLAIGKTQAGPFILPSAESVNQGSYPIARDLYMYTAGQPSGVLRAYLDWIRSPEAQKIVTQLGFVPIQ